VFFSGFRIITLEVSSRINGRNARLIARANRQSKFFIVSNVLFHIDYKAWLCGTVVLLICCNSKMVMCLNCYMCQYESY